jgi:predicted amidohydrolase
MHINDLKVSLIQSKLIWENPRANMNAFANLLAYLKDKTHIAILPEMFTTGFTMNQELLAEETNGETLNWMRENAKRLNLAICGSIMVKENGHYFNRFIFVEPSGRYHCYNKRHLFRMMDEHKYYQMGSERVVFEYLGWRIMPQICYDLRFPVWSRNRNDYDLLIYVANFPSAREAAWNKLLPARAIENLCYVAGVNRVGVDGNGIPFSGNSQIIDPKGSVIIEAEGHKEAVLTTSISFDELKEYRTKFPAHLDADNFFVEP